MPIGHFNPQTALDYRKAFQTSKENIMPTKTPTVLLMASQLAAMTLVSQLFESGHRHWLSGTIKPERLQKLVEKFDTWYGVTQRPDQRRARKKKGIANAWMICWPVTISEVHFYLLRSAGTFPLVPGDQFMDGQIDGQRIQFGEEYYLRPANVLNTEDEEMVKRITWFLKEERRKSIDDYACGLAQHGTRQAIYLHWDLMQRRPMFHGIRQQLNKILRRSIAVWARHHPNQTWPAMLKLPPMVGRPLYYSDVDSKVLPAFIQAKLVEIADGHEAGDWLHRRLALPRRHRTKAVGELDFRR